MSTERLVLSAGAVIAVVLGLILLSTIGVWLFVLLALGLVALFVHAVPMPLIRVVAKAVAIETILPALGLLAFHGGFVGAAFTVFLVFVAALVTEAVLARTGVAREVDQEIVKTSRTNPLAARLLHLVMLTVVFSIALFLASVIDSDVILLGIKETIGAGAVLALIDTWLRR